MERVKSIKFVGVLLHENLSWEDHIKYIENKFPENIGLLCRAKLYLDKELATYTRLFVYSHLFKLCKFIVKKSQRCYRFFDIVKGATHSSKAQIIYNRARFDHNNELSESQKIIKNS